MLSNLVVTKQKVVLIIDELNRERIAGKFIDSLLHEQGQAAGTIRALSAGVHLRDASTFDDLLAECANSGSSSASNNNNNSELEEPEKGAVGDRGQANVILPTLADLLSYQPAAFVFDLIKRLRRSEHVRRLFLWASPRHLQHPDADYILAGCEYMAELVLRLETNDRLSLITRKPGGGVTNRRYASRVTKTEFQVSPLDMDQSAAGSVSPQESSASASKEEHAAPEPASSTFKIELNEDEMVARNALTLPYERTSEPSEGNIIYTPEADDDFDEEDPDEDLCI
ncbi:hypothetical protein KR018_001295 [Drosophila ironensis]|nr:hypothetical protein KR018_001295 [Drosophila ironensis]